jgi:uncharacterized protein (DUF111 family)
MSNQYSGPFIKGFTHEDFTAGTIAATVLPTAPSPMRRVSVIVQNNSSTANITVIFASTGSSGLLVLPNTFIQIDNYNGPVRLKATAADTPVHIAYAVS